MIEIMGIAARPPHAQHTGRAMAEALPYSVTVREVSSSLMEVRRSNTCP